MRIWNEAFSGIRWGDCLKFRLDLQLIPVMAGQHQPGRHQIKLTRAATGRQLVEIPAPTIRCRRETFPSPTAETWRELDRAGRRYGSA